MRSDRRDIRRDRAEPTFETPSREGDFAARDGDRFTPPRSLPNSRGSRSARPERVEPRFDDDRYDEETEMAERQPRRRRKSSKRSAKRARRSSMGLVGRLVYWSIVLCIWGLIGVAGIIGYTVATMPQIDDWKVPARPPNVEIVDASGTIIANRGDTGGEEVTLSDMSRFLPEAVVAIEDRRFYHHFGVDPIGLSRAMVTNLAAGSVVQGGSTLTQQLAKNLFLQPDRTLERKLQEAVLALWLEWRFSKDELLEMYLNRVYLGAGAYGVDAAARRYFGKSARDVNLAEAATIAGLLKAPSRYAPTNSPKLAAERAKVVLAAMVDQGYVSRDEAARATAVGAPPLPTKSGSAANYVADWVMDLLPGYVARYRTDLVVTTTIDARLQVAAENAIRATLDKEGVKYKVSQGALVAVDNDGAVKALVGGKDYAASQFDRAIEARRQPGSAFKPFVYLAAIEHGFSPDSIVVDEPISINGWAPKNYENEYLGPVTLTTALARSLNTVAARLTATLGPDTVVQTARRVGIVSQLHDNPSIALGTGEVTPLEITAAYVPFANGGWGIIPYLVEDIRTKDGKVLFHRQGDGPGRVISEVAVGTMNRMLSTVVTDGTGQKALLSDRPVAGKTGTSQDFRDAWFIGYTNGLTAGVWLGNDDNTPTKKATGGALTALLWNRFMTEAARDMPARPLPGVELVPPPTNVGVSFGETDGLPMQGPQLPGNMPAPPLNVPVTEASPAERGLLQRLFGN
ncbi:penicillin-binding protein [Pleomorphomonas diazotrophica]|uniref:Penicillin-binding protein n=1 Tax=Pleomorphomonas diazotrophica TaxID=1166257 RepID=A0A1I4SV05_9HYPH|nr:penicillin-binding protein 1A [Pleomorphomonas diazotrophica]PKR88551.1 penicillin-binding protein [Pleomorphomonas diazotrophica]SFM68261.1 penicillin-binding protein 1A [Pleomorphomonas diazotrophica]